MAVGHASGISAPKSDPVFLHVKSGMTVIVTDTDGAWRMADVIWVDGGARNPKTPTLFWWLMLIPASSTGSTPISSPTSFQGSEAPVGTGWGRSGLGMQTAALPEKNHLTINSSFK